jgi:hypothetical protein
MTTAAELARLFGAGLLGLFVEDAMSFGFAELPFARELDPQLQQWRPLASDRLEAEYQRIAAALHAHLARAADAAGIGAEFSVVRGEPASALTAVAAADQLIVLVEPTDPFARLTHPFASCVSAVLHSSAALLYVPRLAKQRSGPVVAVVTSEDEHALHLAGMIAAAQGAQLAVFIGDGKGAEEIAASMKRRDTRAQVSAFAPATPDALARALGGLRERMLVVSRRLFPGDDAGVARLAAERRVPALLAGSAS